jgi:hypothetical protein
VSLTGPTDPRRPQLNAKTAAEFPNRFSIFLPGGAPQTTA